MANKMNVVARGVFPINKAVYEYQLPAARSTHEIILIASSSVGNNGDMLLISQQYPARLIKMKLDTATGRPSCAHSFTVCSLHSGFHGLVASAKHPGCVWGTLQFDNVIMLIDASKDDEKEMVLQRIQLPDTVAGPHGIIESGDFVWTTCKDSNHVVKVDVVKGCVAAVYHSDARPIFVAVHPTSQEVYASLDKDSKILRIRDNSGTTSVIDIDPKKGRTPVGLIPGPDGNLWFTLVQSPAGSLEASFGRISSNGDITIFSLPEENRPPSRHVGFLHLAFDYEGFALSKNHVRLWLLSSSVVDKSVVDAIFTVTMEMEAASCTFKPVKYETVFLATQAIAAHRILPHKSGLFVTELGASMLAHLSGAAVGLELPLQPNISNGQNYDKAIPFKCHVA